MVSKIIGIQSTSSYMTIDFYYDFIQPIHYFLFAILFLSVYSTWPSIGLNANHILFKDYQILSKWSIPIAKLHDLVICNLTKKIGCIELLKTIIYKINYNISLRNEKQKLKKDCSLQLILQLALHCIEFNQDFDIQKDIKHG